MTKNIQDKNNNSVKYLLGGAIKEINSNHQTRLYIDDDVLSGAERLLDSVCDMLCNNMNKKSDNNALAFKVVKVTKLLHSYCKKIKTSSSNTNTLIAYGLTLLLGNLVTQLMNRYTGTDMTDNNDGNNDGDIDGNILLNDGDNPFK